MLFTEIWAPGFQSLVPLILSMHAHIAEAYAYGRYTGLVKCNLQDHNNSMWPVKLHMV